MAVLNSKSMLSMILERWHAQSGGTQYNTAIGHLLELIDGTNEDIYEFYPDETIAEAYTAGDITGIDRVKIWLANSIGAQQAFIGYLLRSDVKLDGTISEAADQFYLISYPNEHAKNLLVLHIDPVTMIGEVLPYQNLTTLELLTTAQYWYQNAEDNGGGEE